MNLHIAHTHIDMDYDPNSKVPFGANYKLGLIQTLSLYHNPFLEETESVIFEDDDTDSISAKNPEELVEKLQRESTIL